MYRILIVEDDPDIAEAVRQQAEMWNYQVEIARDFRNIMETFRKFDPHLVLMDISLPFYQRLSLVPRKFAGNPACR